MTADVGRQLGISGTEGVVITQVAPQSPAAAAGLRSGMVITQVNRAHIKTVTEFTDAMNKGDLEDGVLLLVRTDSGSRFVVVKS